MRSSPRVRHLDIATGPEGARVGALRLAYPGPEEALRPRVAAVIVSRATSVEVSGRDRRFESRVARALDLLDAAWPEAARMVVGRTDLVVPVREPGLVSFSSADLPGVVYVNVTSAPIVRLAEDLLHEAAHMRLHEIESVETLVRPEADDAPRHWSPWRREWRPLRGMLHAAYTFTVGARFFERALVASAPGGAVRLAEARRRWLARRLLEEVASVRIARRALEGGSLGAAGRRVARAIASEHEALRPATRRATAYLEATREGRRGLRVVHAWLATMKRRPVRWNW